MPLPRLTNYILLPAALVAAALGCARGPETVLTKHTVAEGEILSASLADNGISAEASNEIISGLGEVFNARRARPGDYYEVVASTDGSLVSFSYYPMRGLQYYEISRKNGGEAGASAVDLPVEVSRRTAKGLIKSSLWEAMSAEGLDGELIIRFAEIFASQVDFLTDTRAGDEFKIVWEEKTVGRPGRQRRIIEKINAAQYVNRQEKFTAVGFGADGLDYDYYAPDGKSLRLTFLRAPLSYRRISSYFSRARFHPVLRIYRPHHGVDYVAPGGTPVSTIGDGVVAFKGRKGGYGNLVRVRHPNGYETFYGHLAGFAKISVGSRVRQGQVVGRVGSTGIATGPHLHFEIRRSGSPLNFLKLRLPSTKKIPGALAEEFAREAEIAVEAIEKI